MKATESTPAFIGPHFGNDWLSNMHEVQLPETISWWPQTIGWQVLLVAIVLWGMFRLYRHWRSWQANAYRREAKRLFTEYLQQAADDTRWQAFAPSIPALVKQVMIVSCDRTVVAPLSGDAWLQFLDQHYLKTAFFTQGAGRCLPRLAYGGQQQLSAIKLSERQALLSGLSHWASFHQGASDEREQLQGGEASP